MNSSKSRTIHPAIRIAIFIFEIALILGLLIIWLSSKSIQNSRNLVVLFFYSFPSEFMVGLIPHEPILLYYGKYFHPLTVAVVAIIGTVLAEAMNYSFFGFINGTELFEKLRRKKSVVKIITLFKKAPFTAILIAGFTPLPFFPIRFLVVMGRYSILKYLLGVFLSRAPRFYIIAQVGYFFKIPGSFLVALFVILINTTHVSFFRGLFNRDKIQKM